MEWHLRWTDEVRTIYHSNIYRWRGLPKLHQLFRKRPQRAQQVAEAAKADAGATAE